jgi:hypothetical protein
MPRGLDLRLSAADTLRRCGMACQVSPDRTDRIMYFVGQGGKNPTAPDCRSYRPGCKVPEADCVGFALWALGKDRYEPPHWWNQNFIYQSATNSAQASRWRFCDPYAGCLALIRGPIPAKRDPKTGEVLVPADKRVGHVGIVTLAQDGKAVLVTHCSPSNHRRVGQGIAETTMAQAFGAREVYYVERAA